MELSRCCSVLAAPLVDDDAEALAHGFAALADAARLRLLSLLASAQGGEVCVCDLTDAVGKSQPTVSHHLKVLRPARRAGAGPLGAPSETQRDAAPGESEGDQPVGTQEGARVQQ